MATIARATLRTVRTHVANREDFDCNGTLSGIAGPGWITVSMLPDRYSGQLAEDCKADDFYMVKSYRTPIAWFANGQWHVPNVRYSVTTSRHLGSLGLPTNHAKTAKSDDYVTLGGF